MNRLIAILILLPLELLAQFGLRDPGFVSSLNKHATAAAGGYFNGLVSTNNLVAYWRMDEVSDGSAQTNRLDSFGANHLTDNSSYAASAVGVITNAVDFESSVTEYFSIADNAALSMPSGTSFTITGWFNLESTGTRPILSKGAGANEDTEYLVSGSSTNLIFRVGDTVNFATATVTGGAATTGSWVFFAARCDLAGDQLLLSINAGTNAVASYTGDTVDGGSSLNVGRIVFSTGNRMDGKIDMLAVWKRLLTDAEITALAAGLDL